MHDSSSQPAKDPARAAFFDILNGSMAGSAGKLIEYPFDTIKVRLQSQPHTLPSPSSLSSLSAPSSAFAPPHFSGPLDCLRQTLRNEGPTGLYRGLSSPLIGAMAENAVLFFVYARAQTVIKTWQGLGEEEELGIGALVGAGAISGAVASGVLTPIELVKCKLQVQSLQHPTSSTVSAPSRGTGTAGFHTKAAGVVHSAPGPIALIKEIYHEAGLQGFFRGQTGTFLRETGGSAAWFGMNEYIKHIFRASSPTPRTTNTTSETLIAGACAGVSYNFSLFPADTIKSRMQTSTKKEGETFVGVARDIWRASGVRGFYRGCGITVARSAPSSALIFFVYERLGEVLK
ncbi:mitochondrial carrier [Saitoella complicata NRRL Y-17804]|uniref:mitochondrial carrier n=1 Tax=Saitoella complicata (strain BCRC 22490 / CBS 7301 / JCM 7358 / NBRC 10748 / NRRL Y-17804) TaxID=698492 RepID=UPI0008678AA8|nr:mitochondrial carrier [Saitoella complicata NRRL Y-17804]ODQ52235.1 mitochondrial carrier [Saitoella complicata NRRL Y-17804]